tara:strand:- start:5697 stop:6218 length:522 start_codon:yes stop_codon:yes gene_type:complete
MDMQDLYDAILEVNYEHWIIENNLTTSFEDFRLEIDLMYRESYDQYPLWDSEMETHLDEIADIVGNAILESSTQTEEQVDSKIRKEEIKKQLLNHVELFLRYKSQRFEQEYPQNRRLKRKDVWNIQMVDFAAGDIEEDDAYIEAFQELVEEGYYKLVETGGDEKHDIFHVVEV